MLDDLNTLRRARQHARPPRHATPRNARRPGPQRMWGAWAFSLSVLSTTLMLTLWHWPHQGMAILIPALERGLQVGLVVLVCYTALPLLGASVYLLRYRALPPRTWFAQFSGVQLTVSVLALAAGLAGVVYLVLPVSLDWRYFLIQTLLVAVLFFVLAYRYLPQHASPRRTFYAPNTDFCLYLGQSTGKLLARDHHAALAPGQDVSLTLADACQNTVVFGGIGSGKTTRAIHPLLLQLLDQDTGGLIFDIKGDFKHAVCRFAQLTERSVITLGVNQQPINLLAGLSPEFAASCLKSACLLTQGASLDGFWIDTATELCRNCLGVLAFLPEHYSLHGLYRYVFELPYRDKVLGQIQALSTPIDANQARLLASYRHYLDSIYATFDDKVKAGVHATLAQLLAPFNHPSLIDAFCQSTHTHHMDALLDGAVFLIDLPLAQWGLGGKVAYTVIKLRFFNLMQQRSCQPHWNQTRPVFFVCDEYQDIVSCNQDGWSDLNFWDKSRSSRTLGLISAQSVASFYAAIGNRDRAQALLQNFRQKLCFKTDDPLTLDYLNQLSGRTSQAQYGYHYQQGRSTNPNQLGHSHSNSGSESLSWQDKPVLDPQLFRALGPDYVVALLSINGASFDDSLRVKPVFV